MPEKMIQMTNCCKNSAHVHFLGKRAGVHFVIVVIIFVGLLVLKTKTTVKLFYKTEF